MPIVSYGPRAKMTPGPGIKGSKKLGPGPVNRVNIMVST